MDHFADQLEIFCCPACKGDLKLKDDGIDCVQCSTHYEIDNGIPLLFAPNDWEDTEKDVTEVVKSFYEETPFPNYEDLEHIDDLIRKASASAFARLLDKQVPFRTRVLEVGCGTGQLSNFLGIGNRIHFGTDMCLNSLKLAQQFKDREKLDRVGFYQMNLFKPIFKEETFNLVICSGVLHHTGDAFLGFQSISKLVKKDGYIIIGLYNSFGRFFTNVIQVLVRAFGDRLRVLDPRLRNKKVGDLKKLVWFKDQYKHPHETNHSIGEVLRWFDSEGFSFVGSIPKIGVLDSFSADEQLFRPNSRGSGLTRLITQLRFMIPGGREGGLFIMIGKRKS